MYVNITNYHIYLHHKCSVLFFPDVKNLIIKTYDLFKYSINRVILIAATTMLVHIIMLNIVVYNYLLL